MHLHQRILVTGGSGFLGSHLCERLLAEGAEVTCLDNFFTGARSNVEHLLDHKRFDLIRHDVTFPVYLEIDQVYNLACPASPIHYQHDPVQTTKTSVQHAGPREAGEGKNPAGLDVGGLRRPDRASADRRLLGERQSDRTALML